LTPDTSVDPGVSVPVGGGSNNYTLTVTVKSTEDIKVPDALVRLSGLPPAVQVSPAVQGKTAVPGPDFGTYTWVLTSDTSGTYQGRVQVQVGGVWHTITPATFEIRFEAGPAEAANSWLIQPGPTVADGSAQATVTAKLFDAFDNPATSGTVVFHVPADLTATAGGVTYTGPADVEVPVVAGAASVAVSTPVAAIYVVTADVKGSPNEPISSVKDGTGAQVDTQGRVRVMFGNDDLSGEKSTLTIPTAGTVKYVGGTDTHQAKVELKDASGNPVPSAQVAFQWTTGTAAGPDGQAVWNAGTVVPTNVNGVAVYEFSSPTDAQGNHLATWVWVRASAQSVATPALWVPVGRPATGQTGTYLGTEAGASFTAGPAVDPGRSTFETWTPAVLNNLTDESWARVVVRDRYGNGIGGLDVTFTLPTSQPGTAGTPVFVDGATPPSSKTVTVRTCAYDLDPVPTVCLIDGVYTPGLAYVPVVSDHEGSFPVTGVINGGPQGVVQAGSGPVLFDAGAGSAEASWFELTKTDSAASVVRADGEASYTLKVTVMNGQTGSSLKPAAGECVTPWLPPEVSVKAGVGPLPGSCPAGSYVSATDGTVTVELVSTTSGTFDVGASLGASRIATQPHGTVQALPATFVGGAPSYTRSELTSPAGPARADDPAGLMVVATVRDQFGNPASCWSGAAQVPCVVDFWVPEDMWVGSGASRVDGPGWFQAETVMVDYGAATQVPEAGTASVAYRGIEGGYDMRAVLDGHAVEWVDGVLRGPTATVHLVLTDSTPPGEPQVDPSDGHHVTGEVDPGDLDDAANGDLEVVIKDPSTGQEVARCPVKADGSFDCSINPGVPDGTDLVVVIEDPAGNQTDPPVEIVTDGVAPLDPVVDPSNGDTIVGHVDPVDADDAAAGDLTVVVRDPDTGEDLCRAKVQADGSFRCDFLPPLVDGQEVVVVVVDPAGNESDGGTVVVDRTPPQDPTPEPSAGEQITGVGDEPGDKITVKDPDGTVLCETTVGADRTWMCELHPAASVGDKVTIVETDPAGNETSRVWRVGVPEVSVAKASLCHAETQAATGSNFQPGELVTAVTSGEAEVGVQRADEDGQVVFRWKIGEGVARNIHVLGLRGPLSGGPYEAKFTVVCAGGPPDIVPPVLPFTGAEGVVGLVGAGFGLVLAGWLLLLAAKRRRREETQTTS
jgi:hypothetical protein